MSVRDTSERKTASHDEREKRRRERYFQQTVDRELDRTYILKVWEYRAYRILAAAEVCIMLACGAAWCLMAQYANELKPFDVFMWMTVAVKMYHFVIVTLFFSFLSLLLCAVVLTITVLNKDLAFNSVNDALKDVYVMVFLIFSFLAFLFLLCSGILGMRLNDLSAENYYAEKDILVSWCPNFKTDMEMLIQDAEVRRQKKMDALPKADGFDKDFESYITTFQGVLDLQQGLNARGEVDYFQLGDLLPCLRPLEMSDIKGTSTIDRTVDYQPKLSERDCKGRLLPSKQLRTEEFFENTIGTALALALLRSKLPQWLAASTSSNLGWLKTLSDPVGKLQRDFDRVVGEACEKEESAWAERRDRKKQRKDNSDAAAQEGGAVTSVEDDPASGEVRVNMPDLGEEASREESEDEDSEEDAEEQNAGKSAGSIMDKNDGLTWKKAVSKAVIYLCGQLHAQRLKYQDMSSTAVDWYEVSQDVVKDWYDKMELKTGIDPATGEPKSMTLKFK